MTQHNFSDELPDFLTDSELNELQNFLDSDTVPESSMILDTLDGFLTALVIGPVSVPIKRWMSLVWDMPDGREAPAFESMDQAKRMTKLVLKMKESIATLLSSSPDLYCPLYMLVDHESDEMYNNLVKLWATGFMAGIYCNEKNRKPLLDKKTVYQELILPIFFSVPLRITSRQCPPKHPMSSEGSFLNM